MPRPGASAHRSTPVGNLEEVVAMVEMVARAASAAATAAREGATKPGGAVATAAANSVRVETAGLEATMADPVGNLVVVPSILMWLLISIWPHRGRLRKQYCFL